MTLVKNVTFTINVYLADSLLVRIQSAIFPEYVSSVVCQPQVYRLFIIWGRSIMVTVIPGLVWLGVVGERPSPPILLRVHINGILKSFAHRRDWHRYAGAHLAAQRQLPSLVHH